MPIPSGQGNINQQLRLLIRKTDRQRPATSPGILTSNTTKGTIRRAFKAAGDQNRGGAARWS